jgi:hypothetical protein
LEQPGVPEYRAWIPYLQLLDEMAAAGYAATEWASSTSKDPAALAADLRARGLRLLGGLWAWSFATQASASRKCKEAWRSERTSNRKTLKDIDL